MELKTGDIVFDSLHNAYIVAYIAETPQLGPEDADSFTRWNSYYVLVSVCNRNKTESE